MLGWLQRLFSKPTLQLVDYQQGVARFRCSQRLRPAQRLEASVLLPQGERFAVTVAVRDSLGRGHYTGEFSPHEVAAQVAAAFARQSHQLYYKADEQASTHHFRTWSVRSREIPNFKGITTEFSVSQAVLILDGPLPVGKTLALHLELDDQRMPTLSVNCEVVSCQGKPGGISEVTVRWLDLSQEQATSLSDYLRDLRQKLEKGSFGQEYRR